MTGVQTCALPICSQHPNQRSSVVPATPGHFVGDSCAVVLVSLGIVLALTTWRNGPWVGPTRQQEFAAIPKGVDPNSAPWWELTVLPRIGDGLAQRIVEFREARAAAVREQASSPVFVHPSDLQAVRGIGEKTVELIAPYLELSYAIGE